MAGSPFHKDDEAAPISDVNVVPLADVSLVLLIILLVLSPMAAQSMLKVQAAAAKAQSALPSAPIELAHEPEKVIAVEVSASGFALDGRLYQTGGELAAVLTEVLKGREDRKVFVSPDLEAEHGRVVEALEAAQKAWGLPALVQVADAEEL